MKDIVVLYHANCPDGFGGAYAAWKKFSDSASYIAVHHGQQPPEGLEGKQIYCIDYSFKKEVLLDLEKKAKRLVVLDHHIGAKEAVEAAREYVFDNDQSGAGIAWRYFHPDLKVPRLIEYLEDSDLFRNALAHIREVAAFMSIQPLEFARFHELEKMMETEKGFAQIVTKGAAYCEYLSALCDFLAGKAEEIEFEGHKVFAVNVKGSQIMRDEIGYRLYHGKGRPFAIIWNEDSGERGYSLRGDGSLDLSKLAQKYGGNGHKGAASFRTKLDAPLVFKYLQCKSWR